jgi:hypothetical protein
MTDPNTAVLRALGLSEIADNRCIGVMVRIVPFELPTAEITVVVGINDEGEQQAEVKRFNIVPIEEQS